MKGTRFTDEQIIAALRDAEATSVVAAARKHGVSEQSLHRWRKKFGKRPATAALTSNEVRLGRRARC